MDYPYNSPIVLTDDIFVAYGGHTGSSVPTQRTAAYLIAEMQVSEDLETYLLPTIVTGTYLYEQIKNFLILDHAHVNKVIRTRFIDTEEDIYWSQAGTDNIYISLRDGERGLVDIRWVVANCNCAHLSLYPYKVEEVYETGFSSGTSFHPDILLALTTYADIVLNEITGYGNEAPGDMGVQRFSNQQYTEERLKLIRTSFGSSARAQFIKKLLTKHHKGRFVRL